MRKLKFNSVNSVKEEEKKRIDKIKEILRRKARSQRKFMLDGIFVCDFPTREKGGKITH